MCFDPQPRKVNGMGDATSNLAISTSQKAAVTRAGVAAPDANISAITAMEEKAKACRTVGERMGDEIARQAGRLWFVIVHGVWFGVWVILNAGWIPAIRAFDPFPYQFLTFVVSIESIFLSLFILMSQNRSNKQADSRSHLDLQVNLLAEQESTKTLQMLQQLCEYHGLSMAADPEVERLKATTEPEALLDQLQKSLPKDC